MADGKQQQEPLTEAAARQILRDIERNPHIKNSTDLCRLRPKHYLGKYKKAAQNRFNYLIGLKNHKPTSYLTLINRFGVEKDELGPEQSDSDQFSDATLQEQEQQPTPRKKPAPGGKFSSPDTVKSFSSPGTLKSPASIMSTQNRIPGTAFLKDNRCIFNTRSN